VDVLGRGLAHRAVADRLTPGVAGWRPLGRVQGDGRSHGHPIVLRPVSSEDAMTVDWTRVPNEMRKISTRLTNEVPR
jgi:GMP synthase PP-ATPase subunit